MKQWGSDKPAPGEQCGGAKRQKQCITSPCPARAAGPSPRRPATGGGGGGRGGACALLWHRHRAGLVHQRREQEDALGCSHAHRLHQLAHAVRIDTMEVLHVSELDLVLRQLAQERLHEATPRGGRGIELRSERGKVVDNSGVVLRRCGGFVRRNSAVPP
eukprot:gene3842-biopygen8286